MIAPAMDSVGDHSQYVEQVYEKHHARLLRYFRVQFGHPSEAEEYVQETICRFFLFMRGRCWENEVEYIPGYLIRLAGIFCMEKLAEKNSQAVDSLDDSNHLDGFNKIKDMAIHSIKEHLRIPQPSRITMTRRRQLSMSLY